MTDKITNKDDPARALIERTRDRPQQARDRVVELLDRAIALLKPATPTRTLH